MTAGAALGDDALQEFLAAQAGHFDTDSRMLCLKGIDDHLAFVRAHRRVETDAPFSPGELEGFVVRRSYGRGIPSGAKNQTRYKKYFLRAHHHLLQIALMSAAVAISKNVCSINLS